MTPRDLLLLLDLGRGLESMHDGEAQGHVKRIVNGLENEFLPRLQSIGLRATLFLSPAALAQEAIIETLLHSEEIEIGLRLFGGADRRSETLADEVAFGAAVFRQSVKRPALFFRGEPADFSPALGPLLLREGFLVDASAAPGTPGFTGLPPRPWFAGRGADLCSPGRGSLMAIAPSRAPEFATDSESAEAHVLMPLAERFREIDNSLFRYGQREDLNDPLVGTGSLDAIGQSFGQREIRDSMMRVAKFVQAGQLRARTLGTELLGRNRARPRIDDRRQGDQAPEEWLLEQPGSFRIALRAPTPEGLEKRLCDAGHEVVAEDSESCDVVLDLMGLGREPGFAIETHLVSSRRHLRMGGSLILGLRDHEDEAPREEHMRTMVDLILPAHGFSGQGVMVDSHGVPIFMIAHRCGHEGSDLVVPAQARSHEDRRRISFGIITSGQRPDKLNRLVQTIRAQDLDDAQILVVGEFEEGEGYDYLPEIEAAREGRLGAMRNRAVSAARNDIFCVLDDDILLTPGWARALAMRAEGFDILTSRLRLPDGGRYWDHATVNGPRGQVLLDPDERDDFLYTTGGGAWLMTRRVFDQVAWSDDLGFYESEDVDFSDRCVAAGFDIAHESTMIAFHDDPKYTQVGRRVLVRKNDRSADWVLGEPGFATVAGALAHIRDRIGGDQSAEAADTIRYARSLYPECESISALWRGLVVRCDGMRLDEPFFIEGDPLLERTYKWAHDWGMESQGVLR